MTTVEQEHAFRVYCEGKSSRELYYLSCRERDLRCNVGFVELLSPTPDDFEAQEIDATYNYLGEQGMFAVMDALRANKYLITLRLPKQGITDANVASLIEATRSHERLSEVDLSDNEDITNASVPLLIRWLNENKMLVSLKTSGTSIGKSVQRKIDALCYRNSQLEADFFKGDFVRLKRTFTELDSDGAGKISVGALLTQIEIPQVAKALEKKFQAVDRGPTTDGFLEMSEFLFFTYPNFKSLAALIEHSKKIDEDEENVKYNWEQLHNFFEKSARVDFKAFHAIRIYHRKMSEEEIKLFHTYALEAEWTQKAPSVMTPDGWMILRTQCLKEAFHRMFDEELKRFEKDREKSWGPLKIGPKLTQLMMETFGKATGLNKIVTQGNALIQIPLEDLLVAECKTDTWEIKTEVMRQRLLAGGIGGSIHFTFPEWFTYVNESHTFALYSHCGLPFKYMRKDEDGDE